MNTLGRAILRVRPVLVEGVCSSLTHRSNPCSNKALTRSLAILSSNRRTRYYRNSCSWGCSGLHTKGDQELVKFLEDEITAEKKNLAPALPAKLGDFTVKANQAEIVLTRKFHDEEISVSLNVNHTVDSAEGQVTESSSGEHEAELKSRPDFEVDIKVGKRTLSFTCSFIEPAEQVQGQDTVEELFGINEVTVFEGDFDEETYCVSGEILDNNMYSLLMNYLDERGLSEEFIESLSDLCSDHEHKKYVDLLQNVHDFVRRK